MLSTDTTLREPIARDLMQESPSPIPQQMSLRGAARLLAGARLSAAPVVDAGGRCVGLLAGSAFVPLLAGLPAVGPASLNSCAWSDWQIMERDTDRGELVCHHTQNTPLVRLETTLMDLARLLSEGGSQHAVVVDAAGRPVGIVRAGEVLGALRRGGHRGQEGVTRVGASGQLPRHTVERRWSPSPTEMHEAGAARATRGSTVTT